MFQYPVLYQQLYVLFVVVGVCHGLPYSGFMGMCLPKDPSYSDWATPKDPFMELSHIGRLTWLILLI